MVNASSSAAVLWFTGLSGAGKSTLAVAVERELRARGVRTECLDGDAVRALCPAGFTRADRDAHVKRVGFLASRLEHHDVTVVCALISPYTDTRQYVRGLCRRFIEIYVATPLEECERRDVKGLYARARRGEIAHFTGIDDPYEPPDDPELVIDTATTSVQEAVARILDVWTEATGGVRSDGGSRGPVMGHRDNVTVSMETLLRIGRVAERAGAAAMWFYGRRTAASRKQDGSPVTEADRAAHAVIASELGEWDATIPLVSEESPTPAYEERRGWRRFWLVDPLDGTKEFMAGNGEFTVNIALVVDEEPVLGVVFAPALGALYAAGRGLGAWRALDGAEPQRLKGVSHRAGIRIVESRSHPSDSLEAFVAGLGQPVERVALGSSLKFCRVAEGEADLYPRFGPTMEWDVAAGDCIFRNSRADGRTRASSLRYNQPSMVVPGFVVGRVLLDPVGRVLLDPQVES